MNSPLDLFGRLCRTFDLLFLKEKSYIATLRRSIAFFSLYSNNVYLIHISLRNMELSRFNIHKSLPKAL